MRVSRTSIVFGVPALTVVVISIVMTLGRTEAATRPQPARFSGSTVVQRLPSLLASSRLAKPVIVGIVRDEAAVSYYQSPTVLDGYIGAWRDALIGIGATVTILSSTDARDDRSARVLVIPSSPCLTLATREAIASAAERGVGLIVTGLAGTLDPFCRPLGYGLIVELTGAARVDVLEPRDMAYVTFHANNPLSADIPPGARLDLDPGRQVALRHPTRDAFYSDYSLQPQPASRQQLVDGALTHASIGGRRVVYWGFEISDVVERPWDRAIKQLLVRNSVAWAANMPIVTIEPWPSGKLAAASIAQDVEAGFANARYAVDSLRAAGVRSTFYLTSELAERYERLSHRMAESGEIGTHGENHRLLGGLPGRDQRERLKMTQRQLRGILGSVANGLRPPEEQFDTATMTAWLAAGGSYVFGANDSRAAAPELMQFGRDSIILIGRVASDDFAARARHGVASADDYAEIFLREYERVRGLGGHYVLSYHSQVLSRADLVPALATVARRLAADTSVWVATVGEVADWWRARALLSVRTAIDAGGMRIVVRNQSSQMVTDAVLRIALPFGYRVALTDGRQLPSDAGTLRLIVPPMGPGASSTLAVVLQSSR